MRLFCSPPKNRVFFNGREWYGLLGFQRKLWLMNVDDHPFADVVPAMFAYIHHRLNARRGYPLFMGVWLMMLMLMIIHDYSNI